MFAGFAGPQIWMRVVYFLRLKFDYADGGEILVVFIFAWCGLTRLIFYPELYLGIWLTGEVELVCY